MGSLAPEAVEPLLRGRLGRPYVYGERCSPQQLLEPAQAEGATAVCDDETGGAIACAVLLRPPDGRRVAELELVGALAASDAAEQATGLAAQVKWPGDVMVNRYRVGGARAEQPGGAVALGVELAVNQERSQLPAGSASLRTIDGVERDRAKVLTELLDRLEAAYDAWLEGGIDALYGSLGARDFLRGRRVAVDGVDGVAVAIDREGRLEVDVEGERRLVTTGEVTYEQ